MDYQKKYLKYKNKYFFLKQKGGKKCPTEIENLLVQMHKDETTPFITALNLDKQCAIEEIIKSETENLTQVEKDIALKKYVIEENFEFIKILLKKGANPNSVIKDNGQTILMSILDDFEKNMDESELIEYKISDNFIKLDEKVKFLLDHTPNLNRVDNSGNWALDYAVRINYPTIVKLILSKGEPKLYESTMNKAKKLKIPVKGVADEIHDAWKSNNHKIIRMLKSYNNFLIKKRGVREAREAREGGESKDDL